MDSNSKDMEVCSPRPSATKNGTPDGSGNIRKRRLEVFYLPGEDATTTNSQPLRRKSDKIDEDCEMVSVGSLFPPAETPLIASSQSPSSSTKNDHWPGLVDALWKHFLFSGTRRENIERITKHMKLLCPKKGEILCHEGDVGKLMYIVQEGQLNVTCKSTGNGIVDILGPNRVFGELAVLYDSPRAATITVSSDNTKLWSLTREALHTLENNFLSENLNGRASQLKRIPEFEKMNDNKIRRLAAVMQEETFEKGEMICREGEVLIPNVNDKFYTISTGCVQVSVSLKPPLKGTPSRRHSEDNDNDNDNAVVLVENLDDMFSSTTTSSSSSSRIAEQCPSTPPPLLQDGPSETVAVLKDGQWFGEMALLSEDPRSATVVTLERTSCFTLTKSAFQQVVSDAEGTFRRIASTSELRKEDNHETLFRFERRDIASQLQDLKSLQVMHVIGEGAFSVVRLAVFREDENNTTQNMAFALKTMNKQDLTDRNQVKHVNNERDILEMSNHPFILSLIKTFQSTNHIYMLFELVQGGELFSLVINSNGGLDKEHAKFYASCIVEGLSYLHRKKIAYRDLKLENLVISADGYVKIIDFGFAKQLQHEGETTRTLCGTPDYLAPEAVTRQGHSYQVDCWSLGVVLFEMMTQYSPYADTTGSGNQMLVFRRIIQGAQYVDWRQLEKVFNNEEEFQAVKRLLYRLWDPNPYTRLSCAQIKLEPHPYFSGISFLRLREKDLTPPWMPRIESYLDTSHFDVASFVNVRESPNAYTADDQTAFDKF